MGLLTLIRKHEARCAAQRTSEVNARCRVDEVKTVRYYGTPAEHQEYFTATLKWAEAGTPDVPSILLWYRASRRVLSPVQTDRS